MTAAQSPDFIHRFCLAAMAANMLWAGPSCAQVNEAILFQNVHVIVGDGTEIAETDVLVQGDEIIEIGESPSIDGVPIRAIDLSGKTIMSALIDAHAHLGYQSRNGWGAEYYGLENLILNLRQYAYYGFAAVFSAGSDPDDLALQLREQIDTGELNVPRFLFAAGMAPPGEGPNNQFLVHTAAVERDTGMTILRGLESVQQAQQAVREVAAKDIKFIKLWVDDRGGSQTKLSPELYRTVAEQARALDIAVVIHQQSATDMPDLLTAGVDGFLHGRIGDALDTEIATTMARQDVFIVPNLGLGELRREAIGSDPFLAPLLTTETAARLSGGQRAAMPNRNAATERELQAGFQRLLAADVELVLGTDAGAVPDHPFGYTGHRELEIFVRLGVPEMEALVAATANAARHLGLSDMGQIKPGFSADLLILDSNPLQDIRNTRRIHAVYLQGIEQDRAAIRASLIEQD